MTEPIPLSPTANFIGSIFGAAFCVWFGLQVLYLHPNDFARYFHTGYQRQRGILVAMPVEIRRSGGGRGNVHSFVAQPVVATSNGEITVNIQPDNGYTVRGFASKEMALEDAKRIGKIGEECEFLVNSDRTDTFFPLDSDRLLTSNFMRIVGIAFSFLCAALLVFKCLLTLFRLPRAILEMRRPAEESASPAVVRRRSRRSDFMDDT
jgi:hypothetical protein